VILKLHSFLCRQNLPYGKIASWKDSGRISKAQIDSLLHLGLYIKTIIKKRWRVFCWNMGPVPPSSHAYSRGFELRLSEDFILKPWATWAQLEVLVQAELKYNNYILVVTKLIDKVKIGWVSDYAFYPFKKTWFAFLLKVHSAQLHGPIWTPQICNNQATL
jgi:hypothetical protein